jgi:hypothetical protein
MIERVRLARRLRKVAQARGYNPSFKLCYRIVAAARDTKTPVSRLAALVEKESGYEFIFGADLGGAFPHERVTRRKYRDLQELLRKGYSVANGVGYVQVTYPAFVTGDNALWRPKHNLRWGARHLQELIDAGHSYESSLNEYNGDPSGQYGRDLRLLIGAYANGLRK